MVRANLLNTGYLSHPKPSPAGPIHLPREDLSFLRLLYRCYILPHKFPPENDELFQENYRVFRNHCLTVFGVEAKGVQPGPIRARFFKGGGLPWGIGKWKGMPGFYMDTQSALGDFFHFLIFLISAPDFFKNFFFAASLQEPILISGNFHRPGQDHF